MGHLLDLGNRAGRQRTGKHDYPRAGHAQSRSPGVGSPGECTGNDANRRDAFGLCDHCVVETPRCTGSSIRDGVDHHIAVFSQ